MIHKKNIRRALLALIGVAVMLIGVAAPAFATSGWRYRTSFAATIGMDIDGPNHTVFVYDFQYSLQNNDTFGTGNECFYMNLTGPPTAGNPPGVDYDILDNQDLCIPRGKVLTGVIWKEKNMTTGTYCFNVWSYTYPGGYASQACNYVR